MILWRKRLWKGESSDGSLREEFLDWFTKPVARDVEGALLHVVGEFWRDAHRSVKRSVQVFDHHTVLERLARTLIGGESMEVTALHSAAKEQHAAGVGEMPVH